MAERAKVIITDFITDPLDEEQNILGDLADVAALQVEHEDELVGKIEDADAIMLYHFISLSEKTIERLTNCKLIVRCGAGYDNVDHQFARSKGIPVANVPDYGTEEVADSAIGLALSLARGSHFLNSRLQRGKEPWSYSQAGSIKRLRGLTFGIIGFGRIGKAAGLRAKALGMRVVYYDPYVPDGTDKSLGVERQESLKELLSQSHIVSCHCFLNEETHHIIDAAAIARMPEGSFLVNTARGGVVHAEAVVDAIETGHLAGAGIDVLETEPPAGDDPVLTAWRNPEHPAHDRLIINPHSAFYSDEGLLDMRIKGSQNCRRVLIGEAPRNVVN
ncbi:C-terminal binding protein [Planctomycetaceae bacterium]|nr:C-terminal binding protein [Planctomycetaceae bacterium]MDC0273848.1 C-terminal binding protein [Planctomycetaceae bacterium]MDC0308271.1 C-terminal binding protein [Planctomycetaceae bacterium]MDG2388262.1 C-terminal binding protein [Planctomycetaceae bacterium]